MLSQTGGRETSSSTPDARQHRSGRASQLTSKLKSSKEDETRCEKASWCSFWA